MIGYVTLSLRDVYLFRENLQKLFTQQRNTSFPALATPQNKAGAAGWKKGGDTGVTISAVGEKTTALSVLKLREEIKLSTARVLKNWCIKLLL